MGSFGEKLKREREMRAITLDEIAEATKIGTRSLRALEEEHFDQLPGGIFNKGFVRAYAKFLGIDEEQAVADYVAASSEVGNSTTTQMAALADQVEKHRAAREALDPKPSNIGRLIVAIAVIALVAFIGFGGYKALQSRRQHQAEQPRPKQTPPPVSVSQPAAPTDNSAATPTSTAAPGPASTGTTASPPANSQPANTTTVPANNPPAANPPPAKTASTATTATTSPEFPITVTLRADKASWVSVNADGKTVFSKIINPTDQQITLHGHDQMQLVIGNAGGVEVSFNGKSLGPLGQEGQTRKLTITPQGPQ